MRIIVEHIPDPGQEVRFDTGAGWAIEAARLAIEAPVREIAGEFLITRKQKDVRVDGQFRIASTRSCERCGEDVELDLEVPAQLTYLPADHGEAEVELETEELDVGWYEGGELALDTVVSEALALALPPRIACLDVEGCDARTAALLAEKGASGDPSHPGFAKLKDLR